ncbi:hypothetical protein [Asanoa iriomotensis]|uniref:Uncharacterized protein n=1 Tax=Asanoa iriomotensis TaxID=234613 RepID=A0ABQ4CDI1_9ACTN|nr:hypothetical protein [Asanoa iriomotensis]GIF60810.1 hypothetical protein Air01nite_69050 [Asanoa iriomotensis]
MLGLLSSLLIGFRFGRGGDFVQEANRHVDAAATMARLLDSESVHLTIPLCAHRGREVWNRDAWPAIPIIAAWDGGWTPRSIIAISTM